MTDQPSVGQPLDRAELEILTAKINAILPPQYQDCYEGVSPTSMGSAGLKYGSDGTVTWDEIWTSFCELALAGGPPHRGTLLEAAAATDALAEPEQYNHVVNEIGRGIWLVTRLGVLPKAAPGWLGVRCESEAMAAWLVRAIVTENISARHEREMLFLPAGPNFRLEKEIKNVVTAVAKTCHYWTDHMTGSQQAATATAWSGSEDTQPVVPIPPERVGVAPEQFKAVEPLQEELRLMTGLDVVPSPCLGWIRVQCADERMSVWLMRGVIVANILARREGSTLFLSASPKILTGDKVRQVVEGFARTYRLWKIHTATSQSSAD